MTINQTTSSVEYTIIPIYNIRPNRGERSCKFCSIEYESPALEITDFLRKIRSLYPTDLIHMVNEHPFELLRSKKAIIKNGESIPITQDIIEELRMYQYVTQIKTKTNS